MRAVAHYLVYRADPGDLAAAFGQCIPDAAAWERSMEVLAGWSVADRLGQIDVPALVLVGRYDVLSSPPQAYRIARRLPDAEVVVFEHSGHALFYDEPARFLSVVGDRLARQHLLPTPAVAQHVTRRIPMYDVIIVGARVAGAATAMLLARKGMSVLVLDRASFPSDTLSTHQVQLPGIARLHRWGLLDRVAAAGTPATRAVRFDTGHAVLSGSFPEHEGIDALYSPRRTLLDAMLIDAAREAGAEIRTDVVVDELCWDDGTVTGVRGRTKSGTVISDTASVVVGADGKHSFVARAAGAAQYRVTPPLSAACYTYWEGVPLAGGEMYARERRAIGAWPTNDGLVMTYVALPVAGVRNGPPRHRGLPAGRAGPGGRPRRAGARRTPGRAGARHTRPAQRFPAPVRAGLGARRRRRAGHGPRHRPGHRRRLPGRRAAQRRPRTGAVGRARPCTAAMSRYERARNRAARPMFDFTTQLARLDPPRPAEQRLFAAIAEQPAQVQRFFGVLTGAVPQRKFFTPGNLVRLVGVRGTARLMLDKARANRRDPAVAAASEPTAAADGPRGGCPAIRKRPRGRPPPRCCRPSRG